MTNTTNMKVVCSKQLTSRTVDRSLELSFVTVWHSDFNCRLAVTAGHKKEDIDSAISALSKATQKILPGKR